MSRRKAREMALQTLFQLDFNSADYNDALGLVFDENLQVSTKAKEYTEQLVQGTQAHLEEIDNIISKVSNEWKLERMTGVDRNIARIAVYEMTYSEEKLPPNVVINEAVELAKAFGTEDSSRFVNGILGSLVKSRQ
ncbi:transcription antitermination factor NusB [Propionispora hippei]|uniref:Transcription antitermination protein NusB n=1 Tax=Propionispora hippei DSM 15287 TaxID=1123003 RepID=A0A1M6B0F1_9FIRM|nr:transcription antitermination factor NusB [Propionispora hippei]SHI42171.1 NusB antitermination factor [Propionispora hippei DSM 15287]